MLFAGFFDFLDNNCAMNATVFYGLICLACVVFILGFIGLILFIVKIANRNRPQ